MSEESVNFLCFHNNQKVDEAIKVALAWAQNYELDPSNNSRKSRYMIASIVYLHQTANGFRNTLGKALCEVVGVFNEDGARNVLHRFRFHFDSIYNVLKNWRRTSHIPVLFSVKLFSEAYDVLHYAVLNDDPDMVHWLLQLNIDVDKKDSEEKTALHLAASTGKKLMIRCLINFGASLFLLDKNHNTPLESALLNGQFEVVQFLKPELFCNLRRQNVYTLFMKLIQLNLVPQVKYMLRYANFTMLDSTSAQNVLHICAEFGDATMMGILLNSTPPEIINAQDLYKRTPLDLAIWKKKTRMIEQLLAAGAKSNPELLQSN